MTLSSCRMMWGQAHIFEEEPKCNMHHDVVFVSGALYTRKRQLVPNSGYFRAVPTLQPVTGWAGETQGFTTETRTFDVVNTAPEDLYLWVGPLFPHYGHFLVSTLARLWILQTAAYKGVKLLHAGGLTAEVLFHTQPYTKDIFNAMGISVEDLIGFSEPTRIKSILIPEPSFEENHYAHRVFSVVSKSIGNKILGEDKEIGYKIDTPAYVSKSCVKTGVNKILNEPELEYRLKSFGFDIIHPESKPFIDQIKDWRNREILSGYMGSGLHTTIFSQNNTIISINGGNQIGSNQLMIDKICNNNAFYLYPHGGFIAESTEGNFHVNLKIVNPHLLAEEIARKVDAVRAGSRHEKKYSTLETTFSEIDYIDGPVGKNLFALGLVTTSSMDKDLFDVPTRSNEQPLKVDGAYQRGFRSLLEFEPSWSLRMPSEMNIHEVRIFGGAMQSNGDPVNLILSIKSQNGNLEDRVPFPQRGTRKSPSRYQPIRPVQASDIVINGTGLSRLEIESVEVYGDMD